MLKANTAVVLLQTYIQYLSIKLMKRMMLKANSAVLFLQINSLRHFYKICLTRKNYQKNIHVILVNFYTYFVINLLFLFKKRPDKLSFEFQLFLSLFSQRFVTTDNMPPKSIQQQTNLLMFEVLFKSLVLNAFCLL